MIISIDVEDLTNNSFCDKNTEQNQTKNTKRTKNRKEIPQHEGHL